MKKDVNGFGDFCAWCDENYGGTKVGEFTMSEETFLDCYNWRSETIQNLDLEAVGYRKDERGYEFSKKEYTKVLYKVNKMYENYVYACAYEGVPACDLYNLITSMRMHGWVFEAQQLCEELYFSAYDYYNGIMEEYEHICKVMEGLGEE